MRRPIDQRATAAPGQGSPATVRVCQRQIGGQVDEQRRRQSGMRDVLPADQFCQSIAAAFFRRQHQGCTRCQRHRDFRDRRVEARRSELQNARLRRDREAIDLRRREIGNAAVRDDHAFRPAGRTRGVDDIGGVSGSSASVGRTRWGTRNRRRIGIEADDAAPVRRQPVEQRRLRHHHRRARIGQHECQPFRRIIRVERQIGSARLEDADAARPPCRASARRTGRPPPPVPRRARADDAPAGWRAPRARHSSAARRRTPPRSQPACAPPARQTAPATAGTEPSGRFRSRRAASDRVPRAPGDRGYRSPDPAPQWRSAVAGTSADARRDRPPHEPPDWRRSRFAEGHHPGVRRQRSTGSRPGRATDCGQPRDGRQS